METPETPREAQETTESEDADSIEELDDVGADSVQDAAAGEPLDEGPGSDEREG